MPIATPAAAQHESSVKETITSIVIAFVVAFVFRGFVLEPFLIPTGLMAPTLMGAHMRFTGPDTGFTWPVGPWHMVDSQTPEHVQRDVFVHDPTSQQEVHSGAEICRAGDRIFVLKSLYNIFDPRRFEVIVFKNPSNPQENFIKRLTALPGEQVAIVDGDIFVRDLESLAPSEPREGPGAWESSTWRIARKPERVQNSVWQIVFDSRYTPLSSIKGSSNAFRSPWVGDKGWEIDGKQIYSYSGPSRTTLRWDSRLRPITDECPYNEARNGRQGLRFPDSDVRISAGIKPAAPGQSMAFTLRARRHEFRAELTPTAVALRMRAAPTSDPSEEAWKTLTETPLSTPLPAGVFTDVELWHADQALSLYVGGSRVAYAEYNWTPAERVQAATGSTVEQATQEGSGVAAVANPGSYEQPQIFIDFEGGDFQLARVGVWRDLYYQPCNPAQQLAFGATPRRMPALTKDQFFVCGDNSPMSYDARLWNRIDPWVASQIDPQVGVVDRELLVGRAFFVYFPAPVPDKKLWMPDFGRLRFIW